jgi:hypothetical protein
MQYESMVTLETFVGSIYSDGIEGRNNQDNTSRKSMLTTM